MANNANAAQRKINVSTAVLSRSVRRVQQLSEADKSPPSGPDRDTDASLRHDQADDKVAVPAQSTVDDELSTKAQSDADSDTGDDDAESPSPQSGRVPGFRLALIVGLVTILALAALAGWFGYGVYQTHQTDKMRSLYLAVARQGALNLTTINYTEADADIQRILDSSTGQFYDDFSKRAPAFVEVVKQAQAKTDGSIVEAGLESFNGDSARVLVAVRVTTSNKGVTDAQPRHWRMRIDVQKVAQTVKVANVGFVP